MVDRVVRYSFDTFRTMFYILLCELKLYSTWIYYSQYHIISELFNNTLYGIIIHPALIMD